MTVARVRGIDLVYQTSGSGSPMIWGHGMTSSMASERNLGFIDWTLWNGNAQLIRYDARGHGESESTADPAGYHWRELALDQLALADALGIHRYIAGGASMGCATALQAAVIAPNRIAALVLAIPPTAWETRAAQTAIYEMMAQMVETGQSEVMVAGARATPPPDPLIGNDLWLDGIGETFLSTDPVRLARIFRGAAVTDLPAPEAIAAINVPTLIMAWTGDAGHPVASAHRLLELLPHATLLTASTAEELSSWTSAAAEFVNDQVI
jgi:3-oxoadipate enol-lactonase